jgi:hypothetical protein
MSRSSQRRRARGVSHVPIRDAQENRDQKHDLKRLVVRKQVRIQVHQEPRGDTRARDAEESIEGIR